MNVCDRCERPVILIDGRWVHAEVADAVFCDLVMRAPERLAANRDDDARENADGRA